MRDFGVEEWWAVLPLFIAAAMLASVPATTVPAVGRILVATEASRDADFARTVILIVHSDESGVAGLMLNRPTDLLMSRVLPGAAGGALKSIVYAGGPLAVGINAVVRSRERPVGGRHLSGELWLLPKRVDIERELARRTDRVRVYVGLCGWSRKQIHAEIARGLWKVSLADAGLVFDPAPETLWRRLVNRVLP